MTTKINLKSKFDKFHEQWSPKIIAEMNDYQFKLVKIKNDLYGISMRILMRFLLLLKEKLALSLNMKLVKLMKEK